MHKPKNRKGVITMMVETALQLISQMVYKPGWTFTATDHRSRFEGTIKVRIDYPAQNSNREMAPDYTEAIPVTYATFPIIVVDCDEKGLFKRMLDAIVDIETHEAREFLRLAPTYWAPFHPHHVDGMRRWSEMTGSPMMFDMRFGLS